MWLSGSFRMKGLHVPDKGVSCAVALAIMSTRTILPNRGTDNPTDVMSRSETCTISGRLASYAVHPGETSFPDNVWKPEEGICKLFLARKDFLRPLTTLHDL